MTKIDRESVGQALAELGDVVRCRCHEAYTARGLHDPDCQCDSADAVAIVRAALDEAEAGLFYERALTDGAHRRAREAEARADRAAQEARAVALQEAADAAREIADQYVGYMSRIERAILALLDTPAAEALERVRAEAYLSGWVNGSNGVEPPDFGNPVFEKAPGD